MFTSHTMRMVFGSLLLLWGSGDPEPPGITEQRVVFAGQEAAPTQKQAEPSTGLASVLERVAPIPAPAPRAGSPLPDRFWPGSSYGWRTSPRTGRRRFHAGLDYLAPRGTPVRAAFAGVVERVTADVRGQNRFVGYGNAVVVHHADLDRWSFYAHLDATAVEVGQVVEAGVVLGSVGNSTNGRFGGMATHLHFEVRHAREDGRSPYPGPYRRYNEDPVAWLETLGVAYNASGVIDADVPFSPSDHR